MLVDAGDAIWLEYFGYGAIGGAPYHSFDKFFDHWYLFFEFIVVFRWKDKLAKRTGIILFLWRISGFILFEITHIRQLFFFAPNIFEFFFLGYLIIRKLKPNFKFTKQNLIIVLLLVGVPNIIKEYYMHFLEFQTWYFFRDNLLYWLF